MPAISRAVLWVIFHTFYDWEIWPVCHAAHYAADSALGIAMKSVQSEIVCGERCSAQIARVAATRRGKSLYIVRNVILRGAVAPTQRDFPALDVPGDVKI